MEPVEVDDVETCEFARYDREGQVILECDRTDYSLVSMGDEDDIRLCPVHRSWAIAMGDPEWGEVVHAQRPEPFDAEHTP